MRKMSRRKVAINSVVAIVVLIVGLLVVPALAANENGADVIINQDDAACAVFTGDGFAIDPIPANKTKLISTNSTNANKTFQCEVWGYGNNTGSAIVYNSQDFLNESGNPEFGCFVNYPSEGIFDFTTVWRQTISAAGDLKLTCQFNNNQF